MNIKRFTDKTVVVTGAGQGVGKKIASAFADEGAKVFITDINGEKLKEFEAIQTGKNYNVISMTADISKIEDVHRVADNAMTAFGSIDILINNAGISMTKEMMELTGPDWDLVFDVNARGAFFMLQAAARKMMEKGTGGCIVNVASVAGEKGRPLFLAYSASKAAVISITRSAALGLADHGIRVNAVSPGTVDTPMWDQIADKMSEIQDLEARTIKETWLDKIPLKRLAKPDDIASMVMFLCCDEAGYITGQTFNVCGGISLL